MQNTIQSSPTSGALKIKHTYSTVMPLKYRNADLKKKIGVPLCDINDDGEKTLQERDTRCKNEIGSKENLIFGEIFYANAVRKEFANEKMRNAIVKLQMSPLYRHEIKQKAKIVLEKIAKWDGEIAKVLLTEKEMHLDLYDGLHEYASQQLERLYIPFHFGIAQDLTRYECKYVDIMASFEAALAIAEFSCKKLTQDIGQYYIQCPTVASLSCMVEENILNAFSQLRNLLAKKISPNDSVIDLNKNPNTTTAANNLFNTFGFNNKIKTIVNEYFEKNDKNQNENNQ